MRSQNTVKGFCGSVALMFLLCMEANADVSFGVPFETDPAEPFIYDIYAYEIVGASGENGGLVVFEDGGTISGMPIDGAGEPIAPQVIQFSPSDSANGAYYPSVAFGDGMYLVGWSSNGVAVQLASATGELIGDPIQLDDDGYFPTIVWNGTAFLISWQAFSDNGTDIAFAKIGTDGVVQLNELVTQVADATEPAVAEASGVSLIAWYANPATQSTGVYGVMVDSEGATLSEPFQISDIASGYDVRVSSDGNQFLVVWLDGSSLFGRLVTSPDNMTDVFEIVSGGIVSSPIVAFDGTNFGIVYNDYQDTNQISFLRVSTDGALVGEVTPVGFVYPNANTAPALIPFGEGYYVAYQGEYGIWGVATDDVLSPISDEIGLSLLPHPQSSVNVIFNGTDFVISFTDEREGEYIYSTHAVRVSEEGVVLETEAMHISDETHRGSYASIATLGDGDSVVVWRLWEEGVGQMSRVIHADGTLGEMITISDAATSSISIAAHGEQYFVVSVDGSLSPSSFTAVGQYLDTSGTPVGNPVALLTQASSLNASIHAASDGYLMFFRDGATYGMPIGPSGEQGEIFTLAPASALVQTVVNETQTLVVWSEAGGARYGQFYESGQLIGEKFMIASDGTFGNTTWNGTRFVAVWEDSDDATFVRYIDSDGVMRPVETLFGPDECFGPRISSSLAGQLLLSCRTYLNDFRISRFLNYMIEVPVTDPIPQDTDSVDTDSVDTDTVDATPNDTEDAIEDTDSETISPDSDTVTPTIDDSDSDSSIPGIDTGITDDETTDDSGAEVVENSKSSSDSGCGCSIFQPTPQKTNLLALILNLL